MTCIKENPILVIQRDDTKSDGGADNGGDVESEKDEKRKRQKRKRETKNKQLCSWTKVPLAVNKIRSSGP